MRLICFELKKTIKTSGKRNFKITIFKHKQKSDELVKLQNGKTQELQDLHGFFSQKHDDLAKKIEDLLPGATSVALATAFADRKNAIEENKKWWATLLIISAGLLVSFGVISLFWSSSLGGVASIPARMIIIAGLIILEEFARRNYNIISRLAESYAYKEALAKSYLGYKKEMLEICMPGKEIDKETKSVSVLVKTFLDKLEDDPGKNVFDREKHIIGPQAILDNCNPNTPESTAGKTLDAISNGRLFEKISWPIVIAIGIVAIATCVLAYLFRG